MAEPAPAAKPAARPGKPKAAGVLGRIPPSPAAPTAPPSAAPAAPPPAASSEPLATPDPVPRPGPRAASGVPRSGGRLLNLPAFESRPNTEEPAAPAPTKPRPGLELGTLVCGGVGAAAGVLGAVALLLPAGAAWSSAMGLVLAIGLILVAAASGLSSFLDRLHRYGAMATGDRTEELQLTQRLRITSLMLQVLLILAVATLVFALPARYGLLHLPFAYAILGRGAQVMVAVLLAVGAYAHWTALHTPRREGPLSAILAWLGISIVAVLALFVAWLSLQGNPDSPDVPILALGAGAAATFALTRSRGLPGIAAILGTDRGLQGGLIINRNRAIFLPILAAFALLMMVFLLFILLGLGVVGVFADVARDPVIVGVFVFLALAMGLSLTAAFRLARSEPLEAPLFQIKTDAKKLRERFLLGGCAVVTLLLWIPAFLLFTGTPLAGLQPDAWIHFFCIGLLVALGPYGFYAAREQKRMRQLEERFPDFLRDIASSHKGGLTLAGSLAVAARGDYGPLTPEVQKMADQVSWNVGFQEILQRFAERVRTPLVQRAVTLILQADRSGGATTEVLMAAARDAREIKTLETERRLNMSLYTVVIYVTFFVFLSVAAILYAQFVPQLVAASEATSQSDSLANFGSTFGGHGLNVRDFQLFYLMAAVMQGLGDGIVAGQMGSGKAILGLRHAFVMVALAYIGFALFLN